MEKMRFNIEEENGERLDSYIAEQFEDRSRSFIQKLIKNGHVLVNGELKKSSFRISEGDSIDVVLPEAETFKILPENIDLEIVYQDEDIAIINKPANMIVHPAGNIITGTLVNALLYHIKDLSGINGIIRPGIVHRLDKDTTGLLVIAKNDMAHQAISEQLKNRTVDKVYEAIVIGKLKNKEGIINEPIGRDNRDRKKMAVNMTNGRESITKYEVIELFEKYSRLKLNLITGRTHQIRVHLKHIRFPILGDAQYSGSSGEFNLSRQMLHAREVGFTHPRTGEYMHFKADPPDDYLRILNILRAR